MRNLFYFRIILFWLKWQQSKGRFAQQLKLKAWILICHLWQEEQIFSHRKFQMRTTSATTTTYLTDWCRQGRAKRACRKAETKAECKADANCNDQKKQKKVVIGIRLINNKLKTRALIWRICASNLQIPSFSKPLIIYGRRKTRRRISLIYTKMVTQWILYDSISRSAYSIAPKSFTKSIIYEDVN